MEAQTSGAFIARVILKTMLVPYTFSITHSGREITVAMINGYYPDSDCRCVLLLERYDGGVCSSVEWGNFSAELSVKAECSGLAFDEFIANSENNGLIEQAVLARMIEHTGRSNPLGRICRILVHQ